METCHVTSDSKHITLYDHLMGFFPFFLYWLLIMSCDPLRLVGEDIRDAPSGLATQNTSYPPSHVTRHNTPQHDSATGT